MHWEAVAGSLKGMDFPQIPISIIMDCISSPSFSILMEGSPTKEFRSGRGLRQGDTLSPSLFLVVVKMLSQELHAAVRRGQITPTSWQMRDAFPT